MKRILGSRAGAVLIVIFSAGRLGAQAGHQARVCDTDNLSDCHLIDTSEMGGLRFEDYRVTNPLTVQFDPALRRQELAQFSSAVSGTLCTANPQAALIQSPPAITFSSATAQISEVSYQSGNATIVQEFLLVLLNNFTASNGYTNSSFGFKMTRNRGAQSYYIAFHPGNPGLQNVPELVNEINYLIDPVGQTATFTGPLTSNPALNQAIFGVFLNLSSVLKLASYSTEPAASGQPLWSSSDLIALGAQAQTLIAMTANPMAAPPAPVNCSYASNGYATCVGTANMVSLENIVLAWGGEYLAFKTPLSTSVLLNNLMAWANAGAPVPDPNMPATSNGRTNVNALVYSSMEMSKPIAMLWPTLRADPQVSQTQRTAIDNWLDNTVMPSRSSPAE